MCFAVNAYVCLVLSCPTVLFFMFSTIHLHIYVSIGILAQYATQIHNLEHPWR